ncbi:hypothetical protein JCM30760_04130 [Thiomicrorhabdus hydrogeniphila]
MALRFPCIQIEKFQKGMIKELVKKDDQGKLIRKLGVMGVVLTNAVTTPRPSLKGYGRGVVTQILFASLLQTQLY